MPIQIHRTPDKIVLTKEDITVILIKHVEKETGRRVDDRSCNFNMSRTEDAPNAFICNLDDVGTPPCPPPPAVKDWREERYDPDGALPAEI